MLLRDIEAIISRSDQHNHMKLSMRVIPFTGGTY
jgi:hypothetical protein